MEEKRVGTPFGVFTVKVTNALGERGPEFSAETENRIVIINGKEYTGTIYFKRPHWGENELHADFQCLTRWGGRNFSRPTDAKCRALSAALLPTVNEFTVGEDDILAAKVESLRERLSYKSREVHQAIDEANAIRHKLRVLGQDVHDVRLVGVPVASTSTGGE